MPSATAYLDSLNPEQRRAVEHGAAGPGPFAPLLVIAGAGSGKTNTLAHRVAHLIVNGADPLARCEPTLPLQGRVKKLAPSRLTMRKSL